MLLRPMGSMMKAVLGWLGACWRLCVLLALVSDCVQRSLGAFVRECVCKASGLGLFGRLRGGLRRLQGSASASVCARKVSGVGLLCRLRGGLLRLQGSECESVLQGWSRSQKNPEAAKARRRSSSAFPGRADMCAYCQGRAGGGQVCN